jgi:hypothetical protein
LCYFFLSIFYFETQTLAVTKQTFYHLSHTSSPPGNFLWVVLLGLGQWSDHMGGCAYKKLHTLSCGEKLYLNPALHKADQKLRILHQKEAIGW